MTKYFPSARSITIGIILWGILFIGLGISLYSVILHYSFTNLIIIIVAFMIVFLLAYVVWFKTGYYISKDYLIIKIGPFTHSRIQITSISEIARSDSILSSPANSLNRISIRYGKKGLVLISPKYEVNFINEIKEVNSKVIVNI